MMNGETFDRLIAELGEHIKALVVKDDDGRIDESEFNIICKKSKEMVNKRFKKHSDSVSITGFVEGDKLSFRVSYYNEEARAAYDRSIVFGTKAILASLSDEDKDEIKKYIAEKVKEGIAGAT